jgi:hypothetical protein
MPSVGRGALARSNTTPSFAELVSANSKADFATSDALGELPQLPEAVQMGHHGNPSPQPQVSSVALPAISSDAPSSSALDQGVNQAGSSSGIVSETETQHASPVLRLRGPAQRHRRLSRRRVPAKVLNGPLRTTVVPSE